MLFRQLKYFCSVVKNGSFTKAAEECYISQSAISQQIKSLEDEMGVELLNRHGRSFSVTPAGEYLYRRGQDILGQVDQLAFQVRGMGELGKEPGSLNIGYLNRYEGWEVQGAVAAFALRHPNIAISTQSGSHDEIYHLLVDGKLDVVFNDKRRQFSDRFVNMHLLTCYGYVEVSEGSKLAWYSSLQMSQLVDEPFIVISEPDQQESERSYYRDALGLAGEMTFAKSFEEARMLVAGNRGFLLVEARNTEAGAHSVIRRIPLMNEGVQVEYGYYAFWLKDRTNPLIEEFADILRGIFLEGPKS